MEYYLNIRVIWITCVCLLPKDVCLPTRWF